MDKLTKLAVKYGTDKWGKHNYTPVYYNMFDGCRKCVKKVLEIGVGEGAGLRMWRDFFTNAVIHGAENDKDRLFREERIVVRFCDQGRGNDLRDLIGAIGSDIDIVIDDGSHRPADQVFTALTLMPLLKDDVIYVIEDVSEPEIIDCFSGYRAKLLRVGDRYDDQLITLRKA